MKKDLSNTLISGICWDMAVVVRDLESTVKRLEELSIGLFVVPEAPEGAEGLFYNGEPLESEYKALVTRLGNMQIEIIQPDDKPNPWKEFLDTRGEGIHHIGFQVDDVEGEVSRLAGRGAEVPFIGKINGKTGAAYVDLNIANIVLELTSFNDVAEQ
ncbi:MAG TPA: lactoylglutathione lyase [Dehalococcoidia bacterium]|nr:lactoylglutathione lyase [Dehalococcoidia bacterium]